MYVEYVRNLLHNFCQVVQQRRSGEVVFISDIRHLHYIIHDYNVEKIVKIGQQKSRILQK